MATIEAYKTASGAKRYRVRFRSPDNRATQRRGFATQRDAKTFAATVEVSKLRGEYVAPIDGRLTIAELGPGWLHRQQGHMKPSAYRSLETAWRIHVEPRWGRVRLTDLRITDSQAWVSELASKRGATVVIRAFGVLAGIVDDAVSDRRLPMNPVRGTKLPKKSRRPHTYLSHADVWKLAAAAGDRGPLVLVLAYCGLRWGEATGLRIKDLNLLRRRLTVVQNAVRVAGTVHVGTPKSNRHRTVPIPAIVVERLAQQCEGKARDDLVFPSPSDGSFMRRGNVSTGWFEKAVQRAGVPRITPHDLRHTAASLAVSAGANVKAVQAMLGHASAAMTLDVYADLFSDDLDIVAERLDAAARLSGLS